VCGINSIDILYNIWILFPVNRKNGYKSFLSSQFDDVRTRTSYNSVIILIRPAV